MAWLCTVMASAQDPVFTASVDKNPVSVDDVFSLELTLENARGNITAPDLSQFTVVFGPSRSSSVRIINGEQSSTMSLTYTMRPKTTGTFEIGIAKAMVNGKVLTSSPIELQVIKGASTSSTPSPPSAPREQARPAGDKNLMVRIQLSKHRAYKGEGIVATYILLSRYPNIDLGDVEFPTLNGFWSENVKTDQTSWERDLETVDGVAYRKAILRRQVLFPQRAGTLKIDAFTLAGRVNRSFFNPGTEINVRSNAPAIEVLPLPDPEPRSFDGAVGTFTITAEIDRQELSANEAINLKLTISGRGNLNLITAPKIDFPEDFETYDPETTDRISIGAGGVRGTRTYHYLAIPRYAGTYEIPEIKFTYFDPDKGQFVTEANGPYNIKVADAGGLVPGPGAPIAKSRVETRGTDVRYIITDSSSLTPRGKIFFGTGFYWFALIAPIVIFLGFVVFHRRQAELAGDVVGRKRRRAKRIAKQRLKAADQALKVGAGKDFYAEVFRALFGYLGDKMNIAPGELSKVTIAAELHGRDVNEATIEEVLHVITTAEQARFSPTGQTADELFYRRTVSLIEKLEEVIR